MKKSKLKKPRSYVEKEHQLLYKMNTVLSIPELVGSIIDSLEEDSDLHNCLTVSQLWGKEASHIILKRKKERLQEGINKIGKMMEWIEKELDNLINTIDDYEYGELDNDLDAKHSVIYRLLTISKVDIEMMIRYLIGSPVLGDLFRSQWYDLWMRVKTQQKKQYREWIEIYGVPVLPIRNCPDFLPTEFQTPDIMPHLIRILI